MSRDQTYFSLSDRDKIDALEEDYGKMIEAGLLQSDVVSFDELMSRLTKLQDRANQESA